MESTDPRQSRIPVPCPDKPERPESPLTGLEFDMSRLSLEAENEGLKEKVYELQTELQDEKSHEHHLRREQLVEARQIRQEERKRAQAMMSEVRRKLYKEKQQEVHELRERLLKEKEKEITYIIKQKDDEFRKAQFNWHREKEDLVQKLRIKFTDEVREEAHKSHEKQIRKLEVHIEELKEQKSKVEETCKLAQDADKKKVSQIRRIHSEHEQELTKLKRSSWQEGRKQMAEIRQLTNIIHQLEKKLGVESGHYIRLQLEKDSLRDKLDRIKGSESSGKKSPLSSSRMDLSSDLSMFSFPSGDDSNPLWIQLKQQKCAIAQLKQSIQDKNRRIDLLKQKLFKNRRYGPGGLMHRSMDDILSYESGPERDDCISPVFGNSTESSDTSSLNGESFQWEDNQDAEIIRRLQKEILQLQKAHSLLQAQTGSSVDAKRTQLEREQLQTDLIEAQRQIDELKKDLVESHDRNELLEFQLQESLQRNFDEGNYISAFKIPTLCIDYKFSDKELLCSAEEVKARLEELQNEKKPVLNRDEQLALEQAKILLRNITTNTVNICTEKVSKAFSFTEKPPGASKATQKDFLQLPMFDDSFHSDSLLEGEDEFIPITPDLEEEWLERSAFEPTMKDDVERQKPSEDFEDRFQTDFDDRLDNLTVKSSASEPERQDITSMKIEVACQCDIWTQELFNRDVDSPNGVLEDLLCDLEVQTGFGGEHAGEFGQRSIAEDVSVQKIDTAVQCSTNLPVVERSAQCNILEIEAPKGDMIIKLDAGNVDVCKFKKIKKYKDIGTQLVPGEVNITIDLERVLPDDQTSLHSTKDSGIDKDVQCNIIEILTHQEEILEIFTEFETRRFREIPILNDVAVQTEIDITDNDVIFNDTMVEVMSDDIKVDDVKGDDVRDDVMCSEVREKHDGEASEKTLLGLGWKDFVDGSELGDDAKHLDCIVYEKEDVFIVICESYRKYCKEISSNDYTFDFDNDAACDQVETHPEDQMKYVLKQNTSDDNMLADKVNSRRNLDVDDNKNISAAIKQVPLEMKTVEGQYIETCDIGIQCGDQEGECVAENGVKVDTCPHCLRLLSASPGNKMLLANQTIESRSFPDGAADSSMPYSRLNEMDVAEMNEELGDEFHLADVDFGFREMCDFSVQCVLDNDDIHDHPHLSSCRDIGIQYELADILPSDDTICSLKNVPCRSCGHCIPSCSEKDTQCEFADLLSASNEMLDIPDGVLREDEGESLIKEVMALAKECSQNDALIDQHLSEVVRGQGLFCQIQDGKHNDQEEIPSGDEHNPDLHLQIPNSQFLSEDEEIAQNFDTIPDQYEVPSEEGIPHFSWKELIDVETQCEGICTLELREDKAVQCTILDDSEVFAGYKRKDDSLPEEHDYITADHGESRLRETSVLTDDGGESRVIAESTSSNPTLNIDLNNVFDEMEARPVNPIHHVVLTPQEEPSDVSEESPIVTRRHDGVPRSIIEEPRIIRTSKDDTLDALDETLEAFAAKEAEFMNGESSAGSNIKQTENVYHSRHVDISAKGTERELEGSTFKLSDGGQGRLTSAESEQSSVLDETSSSENSSQTTVENRNPALQDSSTPIVNSHPPTQTNHPPTTDLPPPLPVTLPPDLPSVSPPSLMHNDLDDDIDELLAGELYQDIGEMTPDNIENPHGIRVTLEQEIETILESDDSSVRSESNTVMSVDSLGVNQASRIGSNTRHIRMDSLEKINQHENTAVFNDASFHDNDVISDDVTSMSDDVVYNDDVILKTDDHLTFASVENFALDTHSKSTRKSMNFYGSSQRIVDWDSAPVKHVAFESEASEASTAGSSSVSEPPLRRQPPAVLPKPKYRSHSTNLPISDLPPVPARGERTNSMAAQKDIVDGYFPPVGLVTKRASEFNLGEFDLLKERILYLERQLKNKENLLQAMRAEAAEIETNAYIQKKEEDIKMMDESVRFLKVENQKKEKELLTKIGEINKYTFELEQLRSERANAERQREILEENVASLQDRVSLLQTVQAQNQELKCKYEGLRKENTHLHEQVNRLHRADEEFVELEKTISKLQGKLKELEDVKRERDEVNEQLKALKTQKDDLAQKGRKVETERNDFLMNNKLIQQQKENLEARNTALQRTNDTFKTKISSLEKECRDSQRKLLDIQRERDEGSSQLRKLDAERNELRKRVNELIQFKSEVKQFQTKSQDLERELNYLRNQSKKIESERTELSTELGNCLKERNRLVGRTAELEKLTRDNEKLEEKFHTLKLKIAELTGQRDDAEVQLPTLKAKVALLKKACKEKDDQLNKLKSEIRELKHSIASSALEDLSGGIQTLGFSSPAKSVKFREPPDFNNNHVRSDDSVKGKRFVAIFDYNPERLSTTGHPERELKLNEGDVIVINSDLDLNGYYMGELDGKRGLVSSLYIEEMDEYNMRKLKKQRELNASESSFKRKDLDYKPPKPSTSLLGSVRRSFVAVKDYNPFTSSTSTRPDLELPLTAGEVLTVIGDVDANGYYTVEKGGRLAITPSNLLKPSSPSPARPTKLNITPSPVQTREQVRSPENTRGVSTLHYPSYSPIVPSQSTAIHAGPPGSTPYASKEITEQFVRQSNLENTMRTENAGVSRESAEGRIMNFSSALPSAPRNLRVLRRVNKDALLLGWLTPELDQLGRNNGHLIKGYKILVNGQHKLDVGSPYMAKALIENLDLSRPLVLAIQTVAENGFSSEKSLAHFNESDMVNTTSVTTEAVSNPEDTLPYRTFVALFSYDPLKSSPNPNPTYELEFQEGDIIRVLDTSRPDGYYTGQVNGNEGLVPSNFLEEIAIATRPQDRKRDKELNGSASPQKAKAMVAIYDYNPSTQSPNKHPDRELSFRKGQIVRVHNSMRSDGFYDADINGERGLVPATFLKPCKRKSAKSVNSTNGLASLPRRVQFAHEQDSRQMTTGYV
ncbi:uncharacterized protein LOC114515911 [Dendronephthya gigantea]|uniref:uncharacterized protein LOC114515911 n=1 Tax=Dendronephthya gigantea TaxID=151771 RepID=UPI00106D332A|nr:uncharacterized protein LOC114515911 [Dendronephthya gigantea]